MNCILHHQGWDCGPGSWSHRFLLLELGLFSPFWCNQQKPDFISLIIETDLLYLFLSTIFLIASRASPCSQKMPRPFTHWDPHICYSLCLKSCPLLSLIKCHSFFKAQLKYLFCWETLTSCPFLASSFLCLSYLGTQHIMTRKCLLQLVWALSLIYRDCKLRPMVKSMCIYK